MPEYKCICCGEIRESEKECSCQKCGYKMYPFPFERSQILRREIRKFIYQLRVSKEIESYFSFYREIPSKKRASGCKENIDIIHKSEDEARFPDFAKIQEYVCAAGKTEKFMERLNTSIQQIRKHFHETFQAEYKTSFEPLLAKTNELDVILKEAFEAFDIHVKLPYLTLPSITLDYSEIPNDKLLPLSDEILDKLEKLTAKVYKFIKINNVYVAI